MPSDKEGDLDNEVLEAEVLEDELGEPSDELLEEDLDDEVGLDPEAIGDDDDDDDLVGEIVDGVEVVVVASPGSLAEAEEATEEEEEDDLDDDEVEASLDVILKERLVVTEEEDEEDEEDEPADTEDRGDGNTRVLPKQPGEFVCQSCFLVKSDTQLADHKRMLCRDCV